MTISTLQKLHLVAAVLAATAHAQVAPSPPAEATPASTAEASLSADGPGTGPAALHSYRDDVDPGHAAIASYRD